MGTDCNMPPSGSLAKQGFKGCFSTFARGKFRFITVNPAQAGVGSQVAKQIGKFLVRKAPHYFRNNQQKQSNYVQPSPTYNRR